MFSTSASAAPPSSDHSSGHSSGHHVLNVSAAAVVFIGGCAGTGLRYLLSFFPSSGLDGEGAAFRPGTFIANMVACFCYAALTAYLAQATWLQQRHRELTGRGIGMGVCGGLSTLSSLDVEVVTAMRGGDAIGGLLYLLLTFGCGLLVALLGVQAGVAIARKRAGSHSPGERKEARWKR